MSFQLAASLLHLLGPLRGAGTTGPAAHHSCTRRASSRRPGTLAICGSIKPNTTGFCGPASHRQSHIAAPVFLSREMMRAIHDQRANEALQKQAVSGQLYARRATRRLYRAPESQYKAAASTEADDRTSDALAVPRRSMEVRRDLAALICQEIGLQVVGRLSEPYSMPCSTRGLPHPRRIDRCRSIAQQAVDFHRASINRYLRPNTASSISPCSLRS